MNIFKKPLNLKEFTSITNLIINSLINNIILYQFGINIIIKSWGFIY
jgi:hypothetical protein